MILTTKNIEKKRVALKIAYDGSDYAGWQRQKDVLSVQEAIENILSTILKDDTHIVSSGRTDAGVHSLGQVAHFDTRANMPASRYCVALNSLLPSDIRILESWEVSEGFHARYSPLSKEYRYTIRNSDIGSAIYGRFEWHIRQKLNVANMREAAGKFLGKHDFSCFTKTSCTIKNKTRTIYKSEIVEENDLIYYNIEGSGFLYNMVRIIIGTLAGIGKGAISIEVIDQLLAGDNSIKVGATAPPTGLTLMNVKYDSQSELNQ